MVPCWTKNRSQIDVLSKWCEKLSGIGFPTLFSIKSCFLGIQNPSKNNQKMKSTWEGLLDSIFSGF